MKAKEAPKSVYLALNVFGDVIKDQWQFHRLRDDDIEYIRKDAFIEKACDYINRHLALLDTENKDCMPKWLEEFKKAME